jgi:putative flippase GtrA
MKSQLASKPETVGEAAPGPFASFVRFVVCGGGIGVLSSGAVALLAGAMPWALANAVITVASTILCTELHALFTFGTGRRPGWRRHWQSAGSAAAAYAVTSLAMLVLHMVQSSPGMLTEQVVYLSASGLAGIGRFLVLRLFVFAGDRNRITTVSAKRPTLSPAPVPVASVTVAPSSYIPVPGWSRAAMKASAAWSRADAASTSALSWSGTSNLPSQAATYASVAAGA